MILSMFRRPRIFLLFPFKVFLFFDQTCWKALTATLTELCRLHKHGIRQRFFVQQLELEQINIDITTSLVHAQLR